VKRNTNCGRDTLDVRIDADKAELVVESGLRRSTAAWNVVLLHDRNIAWRGMAARGRVKRRLPNYVGIETVSLRLSSTTSVCAIDVIVSF
jgi:hypothetical protein